MLWYDLLLLLLLLHLHFLLFLFLRPRAEPTLAVGIALKRLETRRLETGGLVSCIRALCCLLLCCCSVVCCCLLLFVCQVPDLRLNWCCCVLWSTYEQCWSVGLIDFDTIQYHTDQQKNCGNRYWYIRFRYLIPYSYTSKVSFRYCIKNTEIIRDGRRNRVVVTDWVESLRKFCAWRLKPTLRPEPQPSPWSLPYAPIAMVRAWMLCLIRLFIGRWIRPAWML